MFGAYYTLIFGTHYRDAHRPRLDCPVWVLRGSIYDRIQPRIGAGLQRTCGRRASAGKSLRVMQRTVSVASNNCHRSHIHTIIIRIRAYHMITCIIIILYCSKGFNFQRWRCARRRERRFE